MDNNVVYVDFSKKHRKNRKKSSSTDKSKYNSSKFGSFRNILSSLKKVFSKFKTNKRNLKKNNTNIM